MNPLSDACLSVNVKDVESGQLHIGGCWVIRIPPSYSDVTFGASLKDSHWLSIDEFGDLFVTYAKQNAQKHDDVVTAGSMYLTRTDVSSMSWMTFSGFSMAMAPTAELTRGI
jgi:hypothetical protein